jgi:hypothetical protein
MKVQAIALDKALVDAFTGFRNIYETTEALHRLGAGPRDEQVSVAFKTVMRTGAGAVWLAATNGVIPFVMPIIFTRPRDFPSAGA